MKPKPLVALNHFTVPVATCRSPFYRVQLHIANEASKVFTRNGHDWTKRFSKIEHDAFLIGASSAIIDGEVVVPAADGTTDFSVLQNELKGKSSKIVMIAFDLLYLTGYDLRKLPLIERKSHLKRLIEKTATQFSDHFDVDGPELFAHVSNLDLKVSYRRSATASTIPAAAMTG